MAARSFFIADGRMDLISHGKVCEVETGDTLFIPAYCSHQMKFLCPTVFHCTYHSMDMCGTLNNWNRILTYNADHLDDPLLVGSYLANKQNILREAPVAVRVDKADMPEVRNRIKNSIAMISTGSS
jgi:hypothetical protein